MSYKSSLALFLASGGYIGFIPGAPGTYASVATTAVLYAVSRAHVHAGELYVSVFCLVTAAGVIASTEAARSRGLKDPSFVVIDEVSGQLAAFLLVPLELRNLVLGTVLFRLFDIWKPFPIRRLERLPDGAGIMADDVLAGLYAAAILYLVNRLMGG